MATQRVPAVADQRVKVKKNAGVDQNDVHLTKSHDQVVWDVEETTIIEFESDSPFTWQKQTIPAGTSLGSGLVRGDAAEGKYKYSVSVGSTKNDPTVIVHN
jgi:hypothetical protein